MRSTDDILWAAGCFSGRGRVYVYERNRSEYLRVTIGSISGEVVERFRRAVGIGHVCGPYTYPQPGGERGKPVWVYRVDGKNALEVLSALRPHLVGQKRLDAEHALERITGQHVNGTRKETELIAGAGA